VTGPHWRQAGNVLSHPPNGAITSIRGPVVAIPDYQTLMRPVMELHTDGDDHESAKIVAAMADHFALSVEEQSRMLPSGGQRLFHNRVAWSLTHLAQAGMLERPRRGATRITVRGREVIASNPSRIDTKVLGEFEEYRDFRSRRRKADRPTDATGPDATDAPPMELIPELVTEAHAALADELVERLRQAPAEFLEHCVLQLLTRMGYGGPEGEVRHLGGPGDEGMDGIIRQDALGLDVVYVQAKRYAADRTVQRPDVQAFAGALQGAQASRGIFIATTRFFSGPATSPRRSPLGSSLLTDADSGSSWSPTTVVLKRLRP
jgi:restriction system protein